MTKAAEKLKLYRTDGDDDVMIVKLRRRTDAGIVLADDAATVVMDVNNDGTVINISGTAKGDASGTFNFPTTDLPSGASSLYFDVHATESSVKITYGRGQIITAADIA